MTRLEGFAKFRWPQGDGFREEGLLCPEAVRVSQRDGNILPHLQQAGSVLDGCRKVIRALDFYYPPYYLPSPQLSPVLLL